MLIEAIGAGMTVADLAVSVPSAIQSQDISAGIPLAMWNVGSLPDAIPIDNRIPATGSDTADMLRSDFQVEVQQLDYFRLLALVVGVVIGMKVLR